MAELPEIAKIAGQMKDALRGKTIQNIIVLQEKCANVAIDKFIKRTVGAKVKDIYYKGKWIITSLSCRENILLSLGMGADILYFENGQTKADKYQIKVDFSDNSGYTIRFWWFGKFLLSSDDELACEPNTKDIGLDPFDERFTLDYFKAILRGKKTQIKAFLMDQKNVGGIGNMYMHDILFKARLHPQKRISDLTEDDTLRLYNSIKDILNLSRKKGAFSYESDFFGQKGGYTMDDFLVGYKENQPCPVCFEKIVAIKTGGTTAYICPACQKL
ncbi:MAG TPA: DNA-formamidopyrimidine glycosylase family protein [Clostridia bacterium]|jgi:formamidopyrimidine-DNA glycosylase